MSCGGSEFVFVLNASLPYHMLAACAESLPRPNWEIELYVVVSLIMRYYAAASVTTGGGVPGNTKWDLIIYTIVSLQFYVFAGDCHGLSGGPQHMGAFQETRVGGIKLHFRNWEAF